MPMPQSVEQLLAANYLSVEKAYLDEVMVPGVAMLQRTRKPVEKYYRIGARVMAVAFYAPSLAERMTRACSHREIERPAHVDLWVHAWDSASTQVEPVMPWTQHAYYREGRQHADASTCMGVFTPGEDTITMYDRETRTACFWIRDGAHLPPWIVAAPFRTLFHWFLGEHGIQLVHGALVGSGDRALLFTAKGGSGKSSTALACARVGMTYLGDDYVGIEERQDGVRAHSLYQSLKVAPPGHEQREKQVVFADTFAPGQIRQDARLVAVCIPSIRHASATRMIPVHKAQALLALAPTTLLQLPRANAQQFNVLKRVIERMPCYTLELSEDPHEIASVVRAFLEQHV